jgi:hypothetical protein
LIPLRFELKSWIRFRIEINADAQHSRFGFTKITNAGNKINSQESKFITIEGIASTVLDVPQYPQAKRSDLYPDTARHT